MTTDTAKVLSVITNEVWIKDTPWVAVVPLGTTTAVEAEQAAQVFVELLLAMIPIAQMTAGERQDVETALGILIEAMQP